MLEWPVRGCDAGVSLLAFLPLGLVDAAAAFLRRHAPSRGMVAGSGQSLALSPLSPSLHVAGPAPCAVLLLPPAHEA